MTTFDLATVDTLLSTTRAVRKRLDLDREVPDDVLMDCIRLSQQAPTGSNMQNWRWMVVRDVDKKKRIAELYRKTAGPYLAAAAEKAEGQAGRVYDSAAYLADNLERVPVHVIPCVEGRLPDDSPGAMWAGMMGSIFPAVWSFQLALRSRGLGTCLTTLHLYSEAEVADLLGIPDNVMQVALLPVGYTVGTEFKPAERPPVETIVHTDSW
jgi:nitroreductase